MLERLPPETTVQQVLQKARCNRCKVKSNPECQIIFVGGSLEALEESQRQSHKIQQRGTLILSVLIQNQFTSAVV